MVRVAIDMLFQSKGSEAPAAPACSFCGSSGPDIRLGAGPDGFICIDCVEIFHRELGPKDAS